MYHFPHIFFLLTVNFFARRNKEPELWDSRHDEILQTVFFLLFSTAVNAVGIFRKSGGKQRINHLKEMIEGDPGTSIFHVT